MICVSELHMDVLVVIYLNTLNQTDDCYTGQLFDVLILAELCKPALSTCQTTLNGVAPAHKV